MKTLFLSGALPHLIAKLQPAQARKRPRATANEGGSIDWIAATLPSERLTPQSLPPLDFQIADRAGPGMLSALPNRNIRLCKTRVGKSAHRDPYQAGRLLRSPKHGPAAFRTKAEGHPPSAIGLTNELLRESSRRIDPLAREKRLDAKHASRPALAFEAMADRDANRLAAAAEPELPAGAAGFTIRHRVFLSVEVQCGLHADGRAIERAGGAAEKGVVRP
jgi:hypothetical protein